MIYLAIVVRVFVRLLHEEDEFLLLASAGLVTEFGGLLSHAGVVAREYGLPAVLGVPDVMSRIADGDEVHLDGSTGVVTVVRQPDQAVARPSDQAGFRQPDQAVVRAATT